MATNSKYPIQGKYAPDGADYVCLTDGNGNTNSGIGRFANMTTTFTPATSYAAGNDMGGLLTLSTGLAAGTPIYIDQLFMSFSATTLTATSTCVALLFATSPTSTITDASSPTWNATDPAKLRASVNTGTTVAAGNLFSTRMGVAGISMITDASANIYLALLAGGTFTITGPNTATVVVEYRY